MAYGIIKRLTLLLWAFVLLPKLGSAQGDAIELAIISENITIDAGESALLVCVGFNSDNSSVDITWMRNGEEITSINVTTEDLVHRNRLFKQSFLQLCELQVADSGSYSCIVRNETNSVHASVDVKVNNVIDLAVISNSTTQQVGDNLLLICAGHGQPSINLTWTKDGQALSSGLDMQISENSMVLGGRNFTYSYLKLCSLQTCHSGIYNCSVDNGVSTLEESISVTVEGTSLGIAQVSNETSVTSGGSSELICIGYPAEYVNITWMYDDQYISDSDDIMIREEITTDGKKSILKYSNMKSQDAGIRTCMVSNGCQSATSTVPIFISPGSQSPPSSFSFTIIGIIVGAIVGLLVIIIIVVVAVVCAQKRNNKKVSSILANKQTDGAIYEEVGKNGNYEEVGKGYSAHNYEYTKPKDFNMDDLQVNSAYGVIQNGEHIYMDANNL